MQSDPPQDFDATCESTLTICLASLRSRICAYKIAKTKEDTLGFVLVNLARQISIKVQDIGARYICKKPQICFMEFDHNRL